MARLNDSKWPIAHFWKKVLVLRYYEKGILGKIFNYLYLSFFF